MPLSVQNPFLTKLNFWNWFLLAFLSGSVNVGGYMACQRFVTHVTGFATLFGSDLAFGKWVDGISMILVPIFFLMGAMYSGFLIERRIHKGKVPHYALAMATVTTCLIFCGIAGALGFFGSFGHTLEVRRDFVLLAILCAASGIQNAVVTRASGTLVRTTHLTGLTTDLGVGIIKVLFPYQSREELQFEKHNNWLRLGTIVSFTAGSATGALFFTRFGYLGFLFAGSVSLFSTYIAKYYWEKVSAIGAKMTI